MPIKTSNIFDKYSDIVIVDPILENGLANRLPHNAPDALTISINNAINYRLYAPVFEKLKGRKIIYRERFVSICEVVDIEINTRDFRIKAQNYLAIYRGHNNRYTVPSSWRFGSAWWGLSEWKKNHFSSPYCFSLWTNEDFVTKIESLARNNKLDEVMNELNN